MNYTIVCVTITLVGYLTLLINSSNCVSVEKDLMLTHQEKIILDKVSRHHLYTS